MPNLRPEISYQIANTYVTDSGEGRIHVCVSYNHSQEIEGEFVNTSIDIAEFNFGVGFVDPATANVEALLIAAKPAYFTDPYVNM